MNFCDSPPNIVIKSINEIAMGINETNAKIQLKLNKIMKNAIGVTIAPVKSGN